MGDHEKSGANLLDAAAVKSLAARLSEAIGDKPQQEESEGAWELAHSLSDIEAAFRRFLNVHLPRALRDDTRGPALYDVLLDMGEEFRQVLYHIQHVPFYGYLVDRPDGDRTASPPPQKH